MANYAAEKRWNRPSIMAFSDSLPTFDTETSTLQGTFHYLTDDNRSPLDISFDRIEYRQRMINGRMRSFHVTDKKFYSVSWENLPSRSSDPNRKTLDFISEKYYNGATLTNSSFMAGDDMLEWYEDHTGQFYLILSYDKQHVFGTENTDYNRITAACEIVPVFFEGFSYTVTTRGPYNDLWNVEMSLAEA